MKEHTDFVNTVVQALDLHDVLVAQAASLFDIHPDRLNNGGTAELINLLLTEGDEPSWIAEMILWYFESKGIDTGLGGPLSDLRDYATS